MNDTPQFPRLLGRYELVHLLGQGGMGEVYLAKISGAAGFEKPCIVKTILPSLLKDGQFLDRFHHEAKVLVHLVHSSIAQVYDMGEAEGTYYMALEYVAGVDLSFLQDQARNEGQQIPVPVALYLGQRIAEGLGYAHRKTGPDGAPLGIVHRDVSPHNVMLSYEGEVKVIDFGLAKSAARSKHTLPSTVMGKLGYMSPEQVRAEAVDHRSDIYSCGVIVWELLASRSLIRHGTVGEMMAAMSNPHVPALHEVRPDIDPALDAVVRRALAPSPEERYARSDDFARALNEQLLRSGSTLGAEEVGEYVRTLCPQAFAAQRQLISRVSSSPGVRRTPVPGGTLVPMNTGVPVSGDARMNTGRLPVPLQPPFATPTSPASGYEPTLVRSPSATATPAVGALASPVPAETLQLEKSGPGRKGWTAAIALGALGLIGATAGVTAFLMNQPPEHPPRPTWADEGPGPNGPPRPPPPGMGPPPHGMRPPPPGMGPPHGEGGPMPGGPQPVAKAPQVPDAVAAPEPPATPAGPEDAGDSAEPEVEAEAEAEAAQQAKPKPSESHARPQKLVPAEQVAVMRKVARSDYYRIPEGQSAGLSKEMVLQVVAAPTKDGKARLVGEATVVVVKDRTAMVLPDARVRQAGKVSLLAVLPRTSTEAPQADTTTPPAEVAPAPPPAPKQLNGRVVPKSIGFFVHGLEVTNSDSFTWNDCILVARGRDVYRLGGMASGTVREIPLSGFETGVRGVAYVKKDRVRIICAEGEKEVPVKL
ncbi:MAG TPA: serine/threonine-protein kinase [Archangium sp.]|uniref:serine/threonine protein kinase n=1 Tax=Archangium sp. TaxID=1872627 RepID=UPI002E3820DD|nr:serine/threonine-protein kinase [Archangium sp.]HEX5744703.1 serine/threonine-protein kinase [Archangium sp.]